MQPRRRRCPQVRHRLVAAPLGGFGEHQVQLFGFHVLIFMVPLAPRGLAASSLLRDHPTSLPTSRRGRCLPSALPCLQGSAEISWGKVMNFPAILSSHTNRAARNTGLRVLQAHSPARPALRGFTFVQDSVRHPASSPHGLTAHAVAFDSWLPSEGPTRVFHPLAHHHAQRTRRGPSTHNASQCGFRGPAARTLTFDRAAASRRPTSARVSNPADRTQRALGNPDVAARTNAPPLRDHERPPRNQRQ